MGKPIDLTGQCFGRLTVLRVVPRPPDTRHTRLMFECLCECGLTTVTIGKLLRNGTTKSCGCLVTDTVRASKRKGVGYTGLTLLIASYKQAARKSNRAFTLNRS